MSGGGNSKLGPKLKSILSQMEAAGMRRLVDITQAATALGLDPETPLLGYVVKGELLRAAPGRVYGLAAASRQAKDLLAGDDGEWDRLRPRMNAKTQQEFEALRAGYRAGIPAPGPIDEAAAAQMLELMVTLGGAKLMGRAQTLPAGTFLQPEPQ